jgi:hypothetical protein
MSAKSLAFSTVNIAVGFSTGAYLVTHSSIAIGLLVIILGFLFGISIVGNEIKKPPTR